MKNINQKVLISVIVGILVLGIIMAILIIKISNNDILVSFKESQNINGYEFYGIKVHKADEYGSRLVEIKVKNSTNSKLDFKRFIIEFEDSQGEIAGMAEFNVEELEGKEKIKVETLVADGTEIKSFTLKEYMGVYDSTMM